MRKILAVILGFISVITAFFIFGNPVSDFLVTKNAKFYLEDNFSNVDYYIDKVQYDFKTGNYYVLISLPGSPDSSFTLYADLKGKIVHNTYEDAVLNKWNTAGRIDDAYREAVDKVITSGKIPYNIDIGFGEILFKESDVPEGDVVPDYAISTESLVLDKEYDIAEIGEKAGKLTIYVYSDTVTIEKLADILLEIRKATDEAGVYFKVIDCVLCYPIPVDGSEWCEEVAEVRDLMYEDIYEDRLVDRIREKTR